MLVKKNNPAKLPEMTTETAYAVKYARAHGTGLTSEAGSYTTPRQKDVRVRPVTAGVKATKN